MEGGNVGKSNEPDGAGGNSGKKVDAAITSAGTKDGFHVRISQSGAKIGQTSLNRAGIRP